MKNSFFLLAVLLFISIAQGQVRTPTLYVAGTVLSDEKMLVSVLGTKTIEGNVVSAELNGKKTETKTDNKGHAILDFSAIAAGLVGQGVAVIKTFDKNGQLLGTANTNVQNGTPSLARPVIEQLPKNLPNSEAVTIPGQNLGAEAKLTCGDKVQETLSASDKEMIVFTNAKPGEQPAFVTTPNGVSESQTVNVYSLDFALPKNSITPRENVQAQVHYESIPVGTKLIFTNKSPETIKMTIPGAQNAANECVYTVPDKNGSLPVNITGIIRGNFKIALDFDFKNEMVKPDDKKIEDGNKPPVVFYDEKPPAPPAQLKTLADSLKIKDDVIKGLDDISKLLNGELINDESGKKIKTPGVVDKLNAAIAKEKEIIAAEESILSDRRFSNVTSGDPSYDQSGKNPGNMQKAKENIEKALAEEKIALANKTNAATELNKINKLIPQLRAKMNRAKEDEISADKLKNGTKAEKEKVKGLKDDAEANENEVSKALETIHGLLNAFITTTITNADDASKKAIELKNAALKNIEDYIEKPKSDKDKAKAEEYRDKLKKSRDDLAGEEGSLKDLLGEIDKLKKLSEGAKENLDKITKK